MIFPVYTPIPLSERPVTTVKLHRWAELLTANPDPAYVQNIIGIATHGAKLGYKGPPLQIISDNHSTVLQISDELSQSILDDIQLGRVCLIINSLPAQYAC